MRSTLTIISLVCLTVVQSAVASYTSDTAEVVLKQQKLSGPRLGMTYVIHGSDFSDKLDEKDIGNFISQFGWHFEWLVRPERGGPAFVTELIPFFGGVEYGTVIPSLSLVLGIRGQRGFELGMGPNVLVTFSKQEPVSTTLVVGVGKSLNFSGVSIPLNLAMSTKRDGQRFSFVFGYAINRKSRK